MKILKAIGNTLMVLATIFVFWLAASFIDIASKNHASDENYKNYSDWNLIIIATNLIDR